MKKKRIWRIFLPLIAIALVMLFQGAALAAIEAVVTGPFINVRAGPGTNTSLVTKLNQGQQVPVIGEQKDWLQVQLPSGNKGWIAGWLVARKQVPDPPQTQPVTVRVSEKVIDFDVAPYIDQNNRTMVPIRFVAEALGAKVSWVQEEAKAVVEDQGQKIELWVGNRVAAVNGSKVELDTEAVLKNDRTMIPLRFVSETLGVNVAWTQATSTVDLYPRPRPLQGRVKVVSDTVNLRSGPGLGFDKVGQVNPGTVLAVFAQSGDWYQTALNDGREGWVASWLVQQVVADDQRIIPGVTKGQLVNVRTGPQTTYPSIHQLQDGDEVLLLAQAGDWTQIRLEDSREGWVNSKFVAVRETEPIPSRSPEPGDRPRVIITPPVTEGEQWFSISQVVMEDAATSFVVYAQDISDPQVLVLKDPNRLVLDFPGASLGPGGKGQTVEVNSVYLKSIRTGQFTPDTVRVVADLTGPVNFKLERGTEPNSFVVRFTPPSLEGKLVVIDPGHGSIQPGGWSDPGAVGPTGLYERDVVLDIASKVVRELQSRGAQVITTRTGDTDLSLEDRANLANRNKADIFVSIHANSSPGQALNGTAVYYYAPADTELGKQRIQRTSLAQTVQNNMAKALGLEDLGIREANFSVLRNTVVPSILVEVAFISNPEEEKLLQDAGFRTRAAVAIADGITEYLVSN